MAQNPRVGSIVTPQNTHSRLYHRQWALDGFLDRTRGFFPARPALVLRAIRVFSLANTPTGRLPHAAHYGRSSSAVAVLSDTSEWACRCATTIVAGAVLWKRTRTLRASRRRPVAGMVAGRIGVRDGDQEAEMFLLLQSFRLTAERRKGAKAQRRRGKEERRKRGKTQGKP